MIRVGGQESATAIGNIYFGKVRKLNCHLLLADFQEEDVFAWSRLRFINPVAFSRGNTEKLELLVIQSSAQDETRSRQLVLEICVGQRS